MEFELFDKKIEEIRFSVGMILLLFNPVNNKLKLETRSLSNNEIVNQIELILAPRQDFDFIELFGEFLLVKQRSLCLKIVNLSTFKVNTIERSEFFTPESFIFLNSTCNFLTFFESKIQFWKLNEKTLKNYPNLAIDIPRFDEINPQLTYLSKDKRFLFIYSKFHSRDDSEITQEAKRRKVGESTESIRNKENTGGQISESTKTRLKSIKGIELKEFKENKEEEGKEQRAHMNPEGSALRTHYFQPNSKYNYISLYVSIFSCFS